MEEHFIDKPIYGLKKKSIIVIDTNRELHYITITGVL